MGKIEVEMEYPQSIVATNDNTRVSVIGEELKIVTPKTEYKLSIHPETNALIIRDSNGKKILVAPICTNAVELM